MAIFSDVPTDTASNAENRSAVISALRAAYAQAVSDVDTLGARILSATNFNQLREATLNRLSIDNTRINDLEGRLQQDVVSGALAPEKWEEIAKLTFADMQDAVKTGNSWPISKILWETAAATAQEVKDDTVSVVKNVAAVTTFGVLPVVGLAAAAYLAFKLMPAGKRK